MNYDQQKRDFVESFGDGWAVSNTGIIVCPCEHNIEDDGKCPNGHVSPMRQAGLI